MLRAELLTEAIGPAAKMNSQQNRVNDCRPLSRAVIDLRLAMLSVFIDAIVYLFGARRLSSQSDWTWNGMKLVSTKRPRPRPEPAPGESALFRNKYRT